MGQRKRKILYEKYLEEHPEDLKIQEPEIIEDDEKKDEYENIRVVLMGCIKGIKNLILVVICICVLILASVGATALYYEPTRDMLFHIYGT